ncbi:MAG TPA: corrinoid protein [Gemmatimonadaceae bacterium]|nr:corrinoid protein [Gemmatimonadaceae bacterium]
MTNVLESLAAALEQGDRETVVGLTRQAIEGGMAAGEVLNGGLLPGMAVVGARFRDYEIFLPDVLLAARAMTGAMEVLKPLLVTEGVPLAGRVVLGTVRGDLHDIGKNLVGIMLQGAGYEVIDLGVDVSPDAFVDAAARASAHVIGLSALLTTTMVGMKAVVDLLRERGLRDQIRVIVGGAPLTTGFANEIGAAGYAPDATAAVALVQELTRERGQTPFLRDP